MNNQTFGMMVAALRKEKGMTQLDLAEKMGVTDKAVSKWKRDLSFPDVSSLPLLAETLGVTLDELMKVKQKEREGERSNSFAKIADIALKGVPLAMGIAVCVLSILNKLDLNSAVVMLGIGLVCLAISALPKNDA